MAKRCGSYFYLMHNNKAEVDRLRDSIRNKPEITEVYDIDEADPNCIVLEAEFRVRLPFAFIETLEQSGFRILAEIFDLDGGDAWAYAHEQFIPIPNRIDMVHLMNLESRQSQDEGNVLTHTRKET